MRLKRLLLLLLLLIILVVIILGFYYFNFIQVQKIAVITYHGVVDKVEDENGIEISKKYFNEQMKWLHENGYRTITMDEFYQWKKNQKKLPRKSVLITFDDGWRNTYTNALPILEKYGFNSSVFVIWGYSESCTRTGSHTYIDDNDINDINNNHKTMKLLSHSYGLHQHEFADSKNYDMYANDIKLVKNIDDSIQYYAYPFGHYNDEYKRALKENGYKLAFTFGPYSFASKEDDDFEIPRIGIFENTPFWKFKLKLLLQI